jgi:MHS family citrate/tricarballylate:H+ symporter-like MFS transporter
MAIPLRKRHIAAAVTGNALEFYDFTTYAYFAIQIGHSFFPSHDPFISLMAALVTFGAGFVMRPIGAIVIGRYADRIGRKPAMLLSLGMMGAGVLGLAITPSYAAIGIAAPIIVVLLRLIQGFALGGEVGPTTSFLMEAAPPEKRGLYGALQFASQGVSTLLAGIAGVVLANLLNAQQLEDFGWRIALALGALVVPVGLIIRRSIPETLHAGTALPLGRADARVWRTAIIGLLVIMGSTTSFYVVSFLSTYAQAYLHMKINVSFASTLIFGVCNAVFSLIGGALSDRFGRRPVMIWPRVLLLAAIYPAFLLITAERNALALLVATAVLAILAQSSGAVSLVAITEALPKRVRSTAMATVYALGVATFGGTTQPIVTWLIHRTGNIFAPAWWMIATTAFCIGALLMLEETAPVKVGKTEF